MEGGEHTSIQTWIEKMRAASQRQQQQQQQQQQRRADDGEGSMGENASGGEGDDSRPASSGLSSLGDRALDDYEDMMDTM